MTILTPTYNRAYILKNAFDSLCRQTCFDFEWIIVDDGSTDDTEKLVLSWLEKELPFSLRYFKRINGGKHRAVNKGVQEAKREYILILDSDDHLTENAVEKAHSWIKTIDGKADFAGVSGLKGWINKSGAVGGNGNGQEYIDAKNTERRKYNLLGDKAEIYKTEIMKKYPFPEFEGEKFLSEHVVWDSIAKDGYKIRWFNEVIYKCEYLEDGLTKSDPYKQQLNNFKGFALSMKIKKEVESFPRNFNAVGLFSHIAKIKKLKSKQIKEILQINGLQLFLGNCIFKANQIRRKITKR